MIRSRDFPFMRLWPTRWVVGAATLGPIGMMARAPGTWGSVMGMIGYALVFNPLPWPVFLLLWAFTLYGAMAITNEAEKRLKQRDPGKIILDEMVALPGCFFLLAEPIKTFGGWPVLLSGFLLFRLFDIWKPGLIERMQRIPGGVGVVMDDVMAAVFTCLTLHAGVLLVQLQ